MRGKSITIELTGNILNKFDCSFGVGICIVVQENAVDIKVEAHEMFIKISLHPPLISLDELIKSLIPSCKISLIIIIQSPL